MIVYIRKITEVKILQNLKWKTETKNPTATSNVQYNQAEKEGAEGEG